MIFKKNLNINNFYKEYTENLNYSLSNIDKKKFFKIIYLIEKKIKEKKRIFTCGNGGSASVSNHFLCDYNKSIKEFSKNKIKPRVISLSNSIENITAISNDLNFNKIFSEQLDNFCEKGDCLIALSCSGKSTNITKVLAHAKKKGVVTILITGFLNKKKIKNCDLHLNVNINNYGISEDVFQILMHIMSQYIRYKQKNLPLNKIF